MSAGDKKPVGYRNPPEEHRIKPNEVHNPYGRKGKPKPETDFLDEPFELTFGDRVLKVTRDEAVDYALFKEMIQKGNVSAARELGRRRRERLLLAKASVDRASLTSEEERAFQRCLARAAKEEAARRSGGVDRKPPADGAEEGRV